MKKQITTGRLMDTAAQRAKAEISKSLDDLPYETRRLMGIVAFVPVIPVAAKRPMSG